MKIEKSVVWLGAALLITGAAGGFAERLKKVSTFEEIQKWPSIVKGDQEYINLKVDYAKLKGRSEGKKNRCETLGDLDVANRNRNQEPLLDLFQKCNGVARALQSVYELIDTKGSVAIEPESHKNFHKKLERLMTLTDHLDQDRNASKIRALLPGINRTMQEISDLPANMAWLEIIESYFLDLTSEDWFKNQPVKRLPQGIIEREEIDQRPIPEDIYQDQPEAPQPQENPDASESSK